MDKSDWAKLSKRTKNLKQNQINFDLKISTNCIWTCRSNTHRMYKFRKFNFHIKIKLNQN